MPPTSRRQALKTFGSLAISSPFARAAESKNTVRLDAEHQVIDNFGASDCWSMQRVGTWSLENRNRLADLLFSPTSGAALSCWRFNIGGGLNPHITNPWRTAETFEVAQGRYDWSRQAGERWFLSAAKARGVPQILAFVNSPPGRMTRNGLTYCDKDGTTTNLKPGFEPQYATYLADILTHFQPHFTYLSPINEPQWDWAGHTQEGNRASNADIKSIVRAIAAELKRRNLPTQLAILESGSLPDMWQLDQKATETWHAPYGNYLDEFLGDPSISPLLSNRVGYHSYGSDRPGRGLVEHRRTLGEKMRRYPGFRLWQTEYCILEGTDGKGGNGRDLTMNMALDVARIIHLDLTLAGVSAWQWWLAVSNSDYKDGLIHTDWQKPGDPETILPARLLWVLGNFSRFVRPGMRRIELDPSGDDIDGLLGSAYKDEDHRRVAAVYVNMARQARTVNLQYDLGARPWRLASITPFITSDRPGDELKRYPPLSSDGPFEIPARSVVTLDAAFTGTARS